MTTTTPTAELAVDGSEDIIAWKHRLGGPVAVIGYDAAGNRIGVIDNPITDDEVEIVDVTGTVVRLVAARVEDA